MSGLSSQADKKGSQMSAEQDLSALLGSETRGDLLILFHRNPGLIDTMEGVARRIGRTPLGIETDVKELLRLGVLKRKKIGTSEVILLDREGDKRVLGSVAIHLQNVGRVANK